MVDSTRSMSYSNVAKLPTGRIEAIRSTTYVSTLAYASSYTTSVWSMIFIKLDLAELLLVPCGKLRLSGMGDNGYFSASLKSMTWPLFIFRRNRSPKTSLLTSAVVRLFLFVIYFFFTNVDVLMFLGMGSKNFFMDNRFRSWRNSC